MLGEAKNGDLEKEKALEIQLSYTPLQNRNEIL
jgi:hypothetical protein